MTADDEVVALARRLLRHQGEVFAFVRVAGLTADNNAAERMLRPVVVPRKSSGGTRSARGSTTRMGLGHAVRDLAGPWP